MTTKAAFCGVIRWSASGSRIAEGAQLVEVLPDDEYREEHLPGAIHLPLKSLTAGTARRLDAERPVIVYCWDAL